MIMKKEFIFILILVFAVLFTLPATASLLEWKIYESNNFVVFYPPGFEQEAKETLYYLEKHRDDVVELTGNPMHKEAHIVLEDGGLMTQGYADVLRDKIGVFSNRPTPDSNFHSYENWFRMLGIHELVHIGQMSQASGRSEDMVTIFGNHYSPNVSTPLWLKEGIAVYGESQLSPQEGRLNAGYYDAVLSGRAKEGEIPSLSEITYSHNHYPGGYRYLYGATFFRYLAEEYGEEKFAKLFETYGSYYWAPGLGELFPTLGLDRAAREVYGRDISALYREWRHTEWRRNQDWEIDGERLTVADGGEVSNLSAGEDKLYYFETDILSTGPYSYSQINKLVEYDPLANEKRKLSQFRAQDTGRLQVVDDKLYYAVTEYNLGYENYAFLGQGGSAVVYSYDLETGKEEKILKEEIKDFAVRKEGEIIYTRANSEDFGSEIWRYQDGRAEKIGIVPQLISELKVYDDQFIAVSKGNLSTWDINYLDLDTLKLEPIVATNWAERAVNLDGDTIYYTANYDGYQAIYSYDLATKESFKLTEGGYAFDGLMFGDELYFLSGVMEGMGLYATDKQKSDYSLPEQREPEFAELDFDSLDVKPRSDLAFEKNLSYLLRPNIRFDPVLLAGSDAVGANQYVVDYSIYGLDFAWQSMMFKPLVASFTTQAQSDGQKNEMRLAYPLYLSNLSGVSEVIFDLRTDFDSLVPGASFGLSSSRQRLSLYLQGRVNTADYSANLNYNYSLSSGRLGISTRVFEGFDRRKKRREFKLKGEEDGQGISSSIDLTHKLIEIRGGSWNPNLFLGDIYGNAFVDYTYQAGEEIASGGYELLFEVGVANSIQFVPKVGASYSTEDEIKPYIGLEGSF